MAHIPTSLELIYWQQLMQEVIILLVTIFYITPGMYFAIALLIEEIIGQHLEKLQRVVIT